MERPLFGEQTVGRAAVNLVVGSICVFLVCLYLLLRSFIWYLDISEVLLTSLLFGFAMLLMGAGDLASERQRFLAIWLRLLSAAALVMAWISLVTSIIQGWGAP